MTVVKTPPETGRRAVLIDLENLLTRNRPADGHATGSFFLSPEEARERLDRALAMAGEAEYRLAVGSAPVWTALWAVIMDAGIETRMCPTGKDAADQELLDVADHLHRQGFTTITVISGDAIFATLAARPGLDLRVLAPDRKSASSHLMAAATSARVVVPHADWRASHPRTRRGRQTV